MNTLKNLTALIALSLASSSYAQLTNPGFEQPRVKEGNFELVETIPGWKTTDTRFEIWSSGFLGVAAHEGTQFAELNAYIDGTLYQDSTGIQSGSVLDFTFAHRGRNGNDTMKLTITDLGADNSLGGGDDTVLFTKNYTTGKAAWVVYNSTTEQQIKALGNTVRFAYGAVSTATGELGEGNLLDAANFGVGVLSEAPATIFEHINFGGKSQALVEGMNKGPFPFAVSSVKVSRCWMVGLFSKGPKLSWGDGPDNVLPLTQDDADLRNSEYNDITYSASLERDPDCGVKKPSRADYDDPRS